MAKKGGYGFGIVGCGMIADFHARAIEGMKGGHLACVFSRSKANADRIAKAYSCASYQNYKAFLAHPGLDIVAIATPRNTTTAEIGAEPGCWTAAAH